MNDQLQAQLADVIKFLLEWAKSTQGFILEQAPLIVREAIAYGRAYETWLIVGSFLAAVTGLTIIHRNRKKAEYDFEAMPVNYESVKTIGGVALSALSITVFLINFPDFLKAWFAPRLYLIEWASDIIQKMHGGK
jgi:hypothetical protein